MSGIIWHEINCTATGIKTAGINKQPFTFSLSYCGSEFEGWWLLKLFDWKKRSILFWLLHADSIGLEPAVVLSGSPWDLQSKWLNKNHVLNYWHAYILKYLMSNKSVQWCVCAIWWMQLAVWLPEQDWGKKWKGNCPFQHQLQNHGPVFTSVRVQPGTTHLSQLFTFAKMCLSHSLQFISWPDFESKGRFSSGSSGSA